MKIFLAITAVIFMLLSDGIICGAEEYPSAETGLYEALELPDDEMEQALPEEAERIFEENGIAIDDSGDFTEMSFSELLRYIWERFTDNIGFPVRVLGMTLSAAVLSAAASSLSESSLDKKSSDIYGVAAVLVTVSVIAEPVSSVSSAAAEAIKAGGGFMLTYVPVFAGISASSGSISGAAAYNLAVIAVSEGAIQLSAHFLIPIISICVCFGIIDSINTSFSLSSATGLISKLLTFLLSAVMTVFTAMLSLQNVLGTAADSIGIKTARLAVSNFVPVVGGALSDTYTAVRSGLSLLKSTAGIYGIAAVAIVLLPPVIDTAALYIAFNIGSAFSDMLGQGRLVKLMKSTASAMGMLLGIILCFGAMLIVSTGILMSCNVE